VLLDSNFVWVSFGSLLVNIVNLYSEGQPETIVEDIESMVRSYVEKVTSIVLLVLHFSWFGDAVVLICSSHFFL